VVDLIRSGGDTLVLTGKNVFKVVTVALIIVHFYCLCCMETVHLTHHSCVVVSLSFCLCFICKTGLTKLAFLVGCEIHSVRYIYAHINCFWLADWLIFVVFIPTLRFIRIAESKVSLIQ
jgi:hypothetical protein